MIKAIIFDFYGVFVPDVYDAWLDESNLPREGIYARLADQLDTGKITHEQFFKDLSDASRQSIESIQSAFHRHPHLDSLMASIVSKVSRSYKVGLISNGSAMVRKRLDDASLLSYFDTISLSSELGIIKPDHAIFYTTFDALEVRPSEVLYIDDRISNTEVAKHLGASVITFTTPHMLKEELVQRNIL